MRYFIRESMLLLCDRSRERDDTLSEKQMDEKVNLMALEQKSNCLR